MLPHSDVFRVKYNNSVTTDGPSPYVTIVLLVP